MSGEHYFTARPSVAANRRSVAVTLADRRVSVQTARGVFSPERIDTGTRVLLDSVPEPPVAGSLLDLGCGWGPIALTQGLQRPDLNVYAVDVNERALHLVRDNAAALGLGRIRAARPDEVPAELTFATIWSNPPVRVGKAALHELLRTWLPRLDPGATAYLVVQKNLGSDSLHRWIADELGMPCARFGSSRGFRVLSVG
jgi:16S rRNA (guanine1207-N2)-methyltransferase